MLPWGGELASRHGPELGMGAFPCLGYLALGTGDMPLCAGCPLLPSAMLLLAVQGLLEPPLQPGSPPDRKGAGSPSGARTAGVNQALSLGKADQLGVER